ncbi:MAG: cell wall hydrolase [Hespellia sp.]|nr:cell wall hydrolase [Hespellia sp.]
MKIHKTKQVRSVVALTCLCSLLFSSVAVHASSVNDLENSVTTKQNEISTINSQLLSLAQEIEGVEQQVIMTEGAISQSEANIASISEQEAAQYTAMKSRIKYLYEAGSTSFLEMLFTAEDMNDFLNKADFIQNVSDYDRDQLTQLNTTHQQLNNEQNALKAQQASLSDMKSAITDKQDNLKTQAAAASTDLASINAELQTAKEAEAAALAAEAAKQAAAAAAASASTGGGGGTSTGGSGTINVGESTANANDVTVLAAICQAEAYQQYDYMLAVATVIMNRVNSSRFPNSINEVVYASGQFEPTWTGRLDTILNNGPTDLSIQVAQDAIAGARLSSVSDCYYFLSSWTGHSGIDVGGNVFFQSW